MRLSRPCPRPRTDRRRPRGALLPFLPLLLAGCASGGLAEEVEPRIEPYPGFYQAQVGDDVYLFADLVEKQQFDVEPAALTYREFISRTGQRVYISDSRSELIPRIEVAYERAVDTELMSSNSAAAPPPAKPPPLATRRSLPDESLDKTTTRPATTPATAPATRPSTVPTDRLGPIGDPPPQDD